MIAILFAIRTHFFLAPLSLLLLLFIITLATGWNLSRWNIYYFPLPAEQTNNSWEKLGFYVFMSPLFQEFDGLLPVSSSVGDSSASKDFCWRTIFVIKMADLSKHVLKRKYYCKFSSRALRKVLLNFTSPFWRTKRVCDVVLPESFKCLTSRCWVGTFHWLIQLLRTILTLPH